MMVHFISRQTLFRIQTYPVGPPTCADSSGAWQITPQGHESITEVQQYSELSLPLGLQANDLSH